jgi:hypothetical protein
MVNSLSSRAVMGSLKLRGAKARKLTGAISPRLTVQIYSCHFDGRSRLNSRFRVS